MRKALATVVMAVAMIGFAVAAQAQSTPANRPVIFIYGTEGAWWMNKAVFKLDAKQAVGVTTDALNAFMRRKAGWEDVCYLQAIEKSSYIGIFRGIDTAIAEWIKSKPSDPFHATLSAGLNKQFNANIVAYEKCSSGYGLGLVVTENGNVRDFQYFDSDKDGTNSQLLWIYKVGGAIAMAGCDECGDQSLLHYDVTADRFYWEYTGD